MTQNPNNQGGNAFDTVASGPAPEPKEIPAAFRALSRHDAKIRADGGTPPHNDIAAQEEQIFATV